MCHGDGKAQSCESSNNTKDKKDFTYNLKHGINNTKKHVENEHTIDLALYKLEVKAIKGTKMIIKRLRNATLFLHWPSLPFLVFWKLTTKLI